VPRKHCSSEEPPPRGVPLGVLGPARLLRGLQVADLGRGPGTRDLVLGIFDRGHLPGSSTCCGWKIPDCAAAACVAAAEAGSPRKASALPMKKVPPSRLCTSASLAISLVDSSSTSAKTTEGLAVCVVGGEPLLCPRTKGASTDA